MASLDILHPDKSTYQRPQTSNTSQAIHLTPLSLLLPSRPPFCFLFAFPVKPSRPTALAFSFCFWPHPLPLSSPAKSCGSPRFSVKSHTQDQAFQFSALLLLHYLTTPPSMLKLGTLVALQFQPFTRLLDALDFLSTTTPRLHYISFISAAYAFNRLL